MPSQTNKLFYSDPKNERDRASYRFFMQYIRSLGFESTKLLRFLTGSDIIIIENIEVSFSAMEGLARRPIANTCAPMLELPNSYRNFWECWEYWNRFHLKIIKIRLKLKKEIIYFCHLHVLTLLSFKHVTFLSFKHILPFLFLIVTNLILFLHSLSI